MKLPKARKGDRVLLVEGGGMKGAFAGGVLTSLNNTLPAQNFDLIVAVSSGACSAAYYATSPKPNLEEGEKILNIWKEELIGHKLISPFNPLFGRTLLDQKYLIDYLFKEKYPIAKENFQKQGLPPLIVPVCNLSTLSVDYVTAREDNIFTLLKAATALPIATRGKHIVDGGLYCDAAIFNPLPLEEIIQAGYQDITVIMNAPVWKETPPLRKMTRFLSFPFNPKISRLMRESHHSHYNRARHLAQNPPKGVKIYTIAPEQVLPVKLVTTKQKHLIYIVEYGKSLGVSAGSHLSAAIQESIQKKAKTKKGLKNKPGLARNSRKKPKQNRAYT